MDKRSKIYIAGHNGMVGSALLRRLQKDGYSSFALRSSGQLDLRNQQAVADFFAQEKPDYVFMAAAKVGGIVANSTYRAEFIYDNLMMEANVIHQSHAHGVKKLMFLGSSCIYPKMAPQPLREDYLLTGELESTNEPYAIAKIAGIKLCDAYRAQYGCNFISVMPTNLYGPNDSYDLEKSHVLPALIRKMQLGKYLETSSWDALRSDLDANPIERVNGKCSDQDILDILAMYGIQRNADGVVQVELWGTGSPLREFLHVDDLADACVFLMKSYNESCLVNIGCGEDSSIKSLAEMVKEIVGYQGIIVWNSAKPDGTPRKLMSVEKLSKLGWKAKIGLREGIRSVVFPEQNS
ncbi:MAG: GDP-L-fucose synthase [Prevotellaceae bacterium]|jgi:GDP-L-fucose synthase|nr:GDP-L-fucose synthase [Prevotellaceae bacterium]